MSGISALEGLQSLDISVGHSLGSIGRLRALTSLMAFLEDEAGPDLQLNLENPKLQVLELATPGIFSNASFQGCAFALYSAVVGLYSFARIATAGQ